MFLKSSGYFHDCNFVVYSFLPTNFIECCSICKQNTNALFESLHQSFFLAFEMCPPQSICLAARHINYLYFLVNSCAVLLIFFSYDYVAQIPAFYMDTSHLFGTQHARLAPPSLAQQQGFQPGLSQVLWGLTVAYLLFNNNTNVDSCIPNQSSATLHFECPCPAKPLSCGHSWWLILEHF